MNILELEKKINAIKQATNHDLKDCNIDDFDFLPDVEDKDDLVSTWLLHNNIDVPEEIEDFIDYERLAQHIEECGVYTNYGFVIEV